jgi:hypothetical protein
VKVGITEAFVGDFLILERDQARSCRDLMHGLHQMSSKQLRGQARPGWRFHPLVSSDFVSLSLDMNYRVLARLEGEAIVLHRAVKHEEADRPHVNRNSAGETLAEIVSGDFRPSDVYGALIELGVDATSAAPFKRCDSDDDLTTALGEADDDIAKLALSLYEVSTLVIPKAKYQFLHDDEHFSAVLGGAAGEWELFLLNNPLPRWVRYGPM